MANLTVQQLNDVLDAFIKELSEVPIRGERYIAKFTQTGYRSGFAHFTELAGKRKALLYWEALADKNVACARLKYKGNFVVLQANCHDFREQVVSKLPVF